MHIFFGCTTVVSAAYLIYVLVFNIPFIIIQRYNRPRLLHLRYILLQREKKQNTKETQDATSYS